MKSFLTLLAYTSLVSACGNHSIFAVDTPDPLQPPKPMADRTLQPVPLKPPADKPKIKSTTVPQLRIPSPADSEVAVKSIKDLYKDEYKARRSEDKIALGQKLLEVGIAERSNPTLRFNLLREAGDIAAKNGDLETAEASVKALATHYLVNEYEEYNRVYNSLITNLTSTEIGQQIAIPLIGLIENCISADQYPLAQRLAKDGETLGRRIRDNGVVSRAHALGEKAKDLGDEFKKLIEYQDLLGELTAEGHRRTGLFLGIGKNDWSKGVPELALGDDQALISLANLDLAAQAALTASATTPHNGTATLAAAEAWSAAAPTQARGNPRDSFHARSLSWYRRSTAALDGVARVKCDKRIEELNKLLANTAYGNSVNYPSGAAFLLTFEPDTIITSGTKINGFTDASVNGVRTIATGVNVARGSFGSAAEFTGSGRIDCGNPKQLQITDNMTLCMWLWTDVLDLRRNPINKSYGGEGTITLEPSGALNYFYGINGDNGGEYSSAGMTMTIVPKKWLHFALVRNLSEKTMTWYCDGKSLGPKPAAYPKVAISTQPLIIGDGYTNPFMGKLDDIGYWPRALSEQEIVALYQATVTGR